MSPNYKMVAAHCGCSEASVGDLVKTTASSCVPDLPNPNFELWTKMIVKCVFCGTCKMKYLFKQCIVKV